MNILEFLSHGLIGNHWVLMFAVLLGATWFTVLGVTLFLHRSQAHRACKFHPAVAHVFRFWLWLTTGISTREWVAVHRKHHANTETDKDPHSPQNEGIGTLLSKGTELYRDATAVSSDMEKFGRGTPNDWMERNVYRFAGVGVGILMVLDIVLFGAIGLTFWAIQMMWIPFFAAGVINGLGHWWGYRNFETPDTATNIAPWAFFLGGEELHNNHHAFPSSARFSMRSWEFDAGWQILRGMDKLGLATILREAPAEPAYSKDEPAVDGDTLRALLTHRFQLLSGYWRDVVLPVVREEAHNAGESLDKLKKECRAVLRRDGRFLKRRKVERREELLAERPRLAVVWEYRARLVAIWSRSRPSADSIEALAKWCREAESSGIRALEQYAARLRRLAPAST